MLIAGSIGIEHLLTQMGEINSINDLERIRLEPFTREVADEFLGSLARSESLPLDDAARTAMLDLVGIYVPYFLQILFSEVSTAHQVNNEAVTPEMVRRIYHGSVLGVSCKSYFEHYYGRLHTYYRPQEERPVRNLLLTLARSGAASAETCHALLQDASGSTLTTDECSIILAGLENDFYITYNVDDDQYEFSCKILRDWWLRHHGIEAL